MTVQTLKKRHALGEGVTIMYKLLCDIVHSYSLGLNRIAFTFTLG